MARKIAFVVGYGQSNEKGTGCKWGTATVAPDNTTVSVRLAPIYGHPSYFGSSGQSGMFECLAENVSARTGIAVKIRNFSVGGTGCVSEWCGYTGALGTGAVKNPGDAGYDPSSYIANTAAEIIKLKAQGYEVWNFSAGHQTDIQNLWPASVITQALTNVIQSNLNAGADKVFLGITPRYIAGANESEWDSGTGKLHIVRQTVKNNLGSRVLLGADLSTMTDTGVGMDSNLHRNHAGVQIAASLWAQSLIDSGVIS